MGGVGPAHGFLVEGLTKPMELALQAPAKVNLHLRILGRRPDGYHEVFTLMQALDLADTLFLGDGAQELEFTCDDPALSRDNLVEKAARAWFAAAGLPPRARLRLIKQVPVGAGLGGGSSDAAATLLGLNALHGGLLEPAQLHSLACSLGADVPFFLAGGTALCRGIGEKVEPLPGFPPLHYVLVNPGFSVSTAWVYRNLDLEWTSADTERRIRRSYPVGAIWDELLVNELEEVTVTAHPELDDLKRELTGYGAVGALMSGSGPTVFGVFREGKGAGEAARRLAAQGYWARSCRGEQT